MSPSESPTVPPVEETPTPASPSPSAGPNLPVTGDRTALYAGSGAVLVAAGVALFLVARRRRVRLVTPER